MKAKKIQSQKMRELAGPNDEADAYGNQNYKKQKKSTENGKKIPVEETKQKETKKSFLDFKQVNKLYNQLMFKKEAEGQTKEDLVNQIMKIVEPVMLRIVHKHDGCRILQGCLKFGSDAHRKRIIEPFMHSENLLDLLKSKYGHFLALKFLKFLEKNQLDTAVSHIAKNYETLITQFESAKVVERYTNKATKKKKLEEALKKLITINENDPSTHERLENAAMKITEREIFRFSANQMVLAHALKILIDKERNKILEAVSAIAGNICNKRAGAMLVCQCLNYWDAKLKRTVLKNLKTPILEQLLENDSFAFLLIMKIFKSLDDTVMVDKTILSMLRKNMEQIMQHAHNHEIFLSLYDTKTDYLEKYIDIKDSHSTSKKDDQKRREELAAYIQGDLVAYLGKNINENLKHPNLSKLTYSVMKEIVASNSEQSFPFVESIVNQIVSDYGVCSKGGKDSEALITHPITHRLVKSFVIDYSSCPEDTKPFYEQNLQLLFDLIVRESAVLINTKAIFIIIAFIEFTDFKDELVRVLKGIKHTLKDSESKPGYSILKKYL